MKSEGHGNTLVFTYLNKKGEPTGLNGKFPFAAGAVLVKGPSTTRAASRAG